MENSVSRLLNDKWPVLPVALSMAAVLAPVYLLYLPVWGDTSRFNWDIALPIIHSLQFLPAIVYFGAVNWGMRRKIAAWRLLPVPSVDIGRALWWQLIGVPAIALTLGMAANAAIVYPLIQNPGYFLNRLRDLADLLAIVVNWGGWMLFWSGRFERGKAGPRFNWSWVQWCGTFIGFVGLGAAEMHYVNFWEGTPGVLAVIATGMTALLFYTGPTLPNRLMDRWEQRFSLSRATKIIRYASAAPYAAWILWTWSGIFHDFAVEVWSGFTSAQTWLDPLLALGHATFNIIAMLLVGFIACAGYLMLHGRPVAETFPALGSLIDQWRPRGVAGLLNGPVLLVVTTGSFALTAWLHARGTDAGAVIAGSAMICAVAGVRCERRVLASLPVNPARLTGLLHGAAAVLATIPFAFAVVLSIRDGEVAALPVVLWLCGLAAGQSIVPFRMHQQTLPPPLRWGLYAGVLVWAVAAFQTLWSTPFDSLAAMMNRAASSGEASPLSVLSDAGAWVLIIASALALIVTAAAAYRTYMNLTLDAGVRHVSRPAAMRPQPA